MKWEIKKLPNDRWGIFLCEKYWKFKDKPVVYASSITRESAERRVARMNDPIYDFGFNYVTVKQAREAERKKKAEAREAEKQRKVEERADKKRLREESKKKKEDMT